MLPEPWRVGGSGLTGGDRQDVGHVEIAMDGVSRRWNAAGTMEGGRQRTDMTHRMWGMLAKPWMAEADGMSIMLPDPWNRTL